MISLLGKCKGLVEGELKGRGLVAGAGRGGEESGESGRGDNDLVISVNNIES